MDESIISYATKNNWKRLNVKDSDIEYRLSKRANKRFSTKSIIPVEYFSDTSNLSILNFPKAIKMSFKQLFFVEKLPSQNTKIPILDK